MQYAISTNDDSLCFIKRQILISDKVFQDKLAKYKKQIVSENPDSLKKICICNLSNKQKNWIYNNRNIYPLLYEDLIDPIQRMKKFIHYIIQCKDLFYWIHVWGPLVSQQLGG